MNKHKAGITMLLIAAAYVAASFLLPVSICLFYNLTGIPCPTCGMTRAWLRVLSGDWRNAAVFHPLFWLPAVDAGSLFILHWYESKTAAGQRKGVGPYSILIGINVLLFASLWIYRLAVWFPHAEPMVWKETAPGYHIFQSVTQVVSHQ